MLTYAGPTEKIHLYGGLTSRETGLRRDFPRTMALPRGSQLETSVVLARVASDQAGMGCGHHSPSAAVAVVGRP